ncbi:MAG: BatA domain-containing protein, partial [Planctomycetes bacterium]|nr:BatA domain-containing protein [Planctomycetota bacterium]
MNFLQPAFLWALPLAGIPILIHLLNRRRFQKVEFSAMEFLFRARKKMRRKLILEDWFLLFLRTASVALFILALAQPGSEDPLNESTRPAQGTVVLLDASMSMSHRDQGLSSFDRAQRSALQALSSLESKLGDRAALVLAGGKPRRVVSGSPHEVQLALQELTEPSHEADQWALALKAAHQAGQDLLREGCQTVSIQLFSDFQASGWHLTEVDGESLRTLRDDGFTIIPVNTGSAQRNNWAVTKLQCSPMNVQPD